MLRASIESVREPPVAIHGSHERVRHVLRVEHEGMAGRGEASPLAGFSPDTSEQAARELARGEWREIPLEGDVLRALAALDIASPSARFAIETAVLELVARKRGVRLVDVLGGPRCPSLPLARVALADSSAIEAARTGVAAIKLKLGRDAIERELEGAIALRREIGPSLAIRLDANRRLTGRELQRFAPIAPELVEEPLDFDGLDVPVALDETLARDGGEAKLRELAGVVEYAVLKPTTLGLTRTLALARLAESLGVRVIVSHTAEGPIGFEACVHVAFATMDGTIAAGLFPHDGLEAARIACFDGTLLHAAQLSVRA